MLRFHLRTVVPLSVCLLAVAACSNTNNKKHPGNGDASVYEGGTDGNGAGGADAGTDAPPEAAPDAAPEAAPDAAPDAPADAPMDSPSEPDAALVCSAGTVKDYAIQKCLACPSDGGVEGGAEAGSDAGAMTDGGADAMADGGADAGGDPYVPTLDCGGVMSNVTGGYDPSTGVLDLQLTYPLDIKSVTISGGLYSNYQQIAPFSVPNVPVTDNHIVLTIGAPPSGVDSVMITTLQLTDACGRITDYYEPPSDCLDLELVPGEAGASWMVACVPAPC